MLFSYAVRAFYIESSAMFVRGGVYRVVKEAMGDTLAKISVSALLFDYVLTGPISAVSAGQYLAGFIEDTTRYAGHPIHVPTNGFSAVFGLLVVFYFWWKNIIPAERVAELFLDALPRSCVRASPTTRNSWCP